MVDFCLFEIYRDYVKFLVENSSGQEKKTARKLRPFQSKSARSEETKKRRGHLGSQTDGLF